MSRNAGNVFDRNIDVDIDNDIDRLLGGGVDSAQLPAFRRHPLKYHFRTNHFFFLNKILFSF